MTCTINQNEFNRAVIGSFLTEINSRVFVNIPSVQKRAGEIVKRYFYLSDEVRELLNDSSLLVSILGFPKDGNARIATIINRICDSITIRVENFRYIGTQIKEFVEIGIIQSDYRDILSLPDATVQYSNGFLDWLRWMLLYGGRMIVDDRQVLYRRTIKLSQSRSDHGLMIVANNARVARIPPAYQGVSDDTFLERSFVNNTSFIKEIEQILFQIIQ